jgi:hypothetical protein
VMVSMWRKHRHNHMPMIRAAKDFGANPDPIVDALEHVVFRWRDRSRT